jgi:hypothetical protein
MAGAEHSERWKEIIEAGNDHDWDRLASCISADAVMHSATEGLGSTVVHLIGAAAIAEDHRQAVEKLGMRWELLDLAEAEDLVITLVRTHTRKRKSALIAAVVRFDDGGLMRELYSYMRPPTG